MADRLANILGQLAEQGKSNGVLDILEKSANQGNMGGSSSIVFKGVIKNLVSQHWYIIIHMQINEHCWSVIV